MSKFTKAERRRFNDGLLLLKTLSDEQSVVSKRLTPSRASNVPPNVSKNISNILKRNPKHEVYGSLAFESRTFKSRKPNDIDIVVDNPHAKAIEISNVLRKKGYIVKIESNYHYNSHMVQVKKGGRWVDVVDLHPISEHNVEFEVYGSSINPERIEGVNVQRASDQLLRKANSIMSYNEKEKRMGAPTHRRKKDVSDFIAVSRLLIDSKELKAHAELEKVRNARKAMKSWRKHAKDIGVRKVDKDPYSDKVENLFIGQAVKKPQMNVDDLKFRDKRTFRKKVKKEIHKDMFSGIYPEGKVVKPRKKKQNGKLYKFNVFDF